MAPPRRSPANPNPTANQNKVLQDLLADTKPLNPDDAAWMPAPLIKRDRGTARKDRGHNAALYDSRLTMKGGANADLTLILRIHFRRIDPTPRGGNQKVITDGRGNEFALREIDDAEMFQFRMLACRQATKTWKGGCLVTPNDFTGLDWPRHHAFRQSGVPGAKIMSNMAVEWDPNFADTGRALRPNINCSLECDYALNAADCHAIVNVVAVGADSTRPAKDFVSATLMRTKGMPGTQYEGHWEISDTGVKTKHADQDPAFWWFNREDIHQYMVPHETGHLLGLDHIGEILQTHTCIAKADSCSTDDTWAAIYGHHKKQPMWWARNIMGIGNVVHACNLVPWAHAMAQHTGISAERWIPAGTSIPPRTLQEIPKQPYTLQNSPYTGGFQETGG